MQLKWKIWLEEEGEKIFGAGPQELLLKIEKLGSLRQAAAAMDMSYSKAWSLISRLEKKLDIKVLQKRIGGNGGGGSELTIEGKELLRKYEQLEEEAEKIFQELSEKFF